MENTRTLAAANLSSAWEKLESKRSNVAALGDDNTVIPQANFADVIRVLWAARKAEIELAHAQDAFAEVK